MKDAGTPEPVRISNLTFPELVLFYNAHLARVELTWFRVIYLHGVIVGLLVFFGEADVFLLFHRVIVFAFYTVNLLIFFFAFRDGYGALRNALDDLRRFPDVDGAVDGWLRSQTVTMRTPVRTMVLASGWLVVAFLLFWNVLIG